MHVRLLETLNDDDDDEDNNNHNILVYEQFGFSTRSSTEQANYRLISEILNALNKVIVGGLFCDLEKAVGCVNCGILLSKLTYDGINKADALTGSYLTTDIREY